jgi:hypothetical protein
MCWSWRGSSKASDASAREAGVQGLRLGQEVAGGGLSLCGNSPSQVIVIPFVSTTFFHFAISACKNRPN